MWAYQVSRTAKPCIATNETSENLFVLKPSHSFIYSTWGQWMYFWKQCSIKITCILQAKDPYWYLTTDKLLLLLKHSTLYLNHLLYQGSTCEPIVSTCKPIVSTCKHVSFVIAAYSLHSKAGGNPEHSKPEWAKDCQNFKLTLGICVYSTFQWSAAFFLISHPIFFKIYLVFS